MARPTSLSFRSAGALPGFVAVIFFVACLGASAHLAMAGGEGCQAIEPSVRSCGPTTSLDTAPALPALAVDLDSSPTPTAWIRTPFELVGPPQEQVAPPVPRSPPSIPA